MAELRCGLASRQEEELDGLFGTLPSLGFQADSNIWRATVSERSQWPEASTNRVAQSV